MKYGALDLVQLVRTPIGRLQFWDGVVLKAWPVVAPISAIYRRTGLSRTCLVAVVGSLGKTTTMRAVACALGLPVHRSAHRNIRSSLGQALLRVGSGARDAVIEVGIDRPGEMATFARVLRPDLCVVTAIASDHIRYFGSLERIRDDKCEMLRQLTCKGVAVINGDDPNVRWMAGETPARVLRYGFGADNHVRATDLELRWPEGMRFVLRVRGETRPVRTQLVGAHMVRCLLAAVAVGLSRGIDLDLLLRRLEELAPTPQRCQPAAMAAGGHLLRDEFKSGVESVLSSLDLLQALPARRKLVVLGDLSAGSGKQGPLYREVGARLASVADRAVVVGTNFKRYAPGARRAGMPSSALLSAGQDFGRVPALLGEVGPGDLVLVKGRSSQRLERVSLGLMGREVRCHARHCDAHTVRCDDCPMLSRGWGRARFLV